jgi:hypothetical protein
MQKSCSFLLAPFSNFLSYLNHESTSTKSDDSVPRRHESQLEMKKGVAVDCDCFRPNSWIHEWFSSEVLKEDAELIKLEYEALYIGVDDI